MNGQQMLKRDFVGDLTPREGRARRATTLAAKQAAKSPVTLVGIGAASLMALACQLVAPLVAVPAVGSETVSAMVGPGSVPLAASPARKAREPRIVMCA